MAKLVFQSWRRILKCGFGPRLSGPARALTALDVGNVECMRGVAGGDVGGVLREVRVLLSVVGDDVTPVCSSPPLPPLPCVDVKTL